VSRRHVPSVLPFALLSLSLHTAAFVGIARHATRQPAAAFDPRSQALAGDTLEIEPPPLASPNSESAGAPPPTPTSTPTLPSGGRPSDTSKATVAARPPVFGAVGVRFASDLATTFTRAFPQAASAYPLWSSVAFGDAGRAEVTLVLDENGHLTTSEIAGSPSPALRRSIERTLVLLAPRVFTARAATSKLSVTAYISRDDVHDGLHGDVFALSAGSFTGEVGAAFFALPPGAGPGRRVDIEVKLLP
jgi:hypothetical protein